MTATLLSQADLGARAARPLARAAGPLARAARPLARATARLRPGRVVAYAWLLAGASVAVLQAGHAGFHEWNELPPLLHWFRDASLAVPIAAFAVIVVALAVPWARPQRERERASLGSAAAWGFVAAVLYAALTVPSIQVHGLLFGAEVRLGAGPLEHALGEGITVFQVALLLVPVALLAGVPWRATGPPAAHRLETDAAGPVHTAAPPDTTIRLAAAPVLDGAGR